MPEHADLLDAIELWSAEPPPRRRTRALTRVRTELPSVLVRELIGWNGTGQRAHQGAGLVPPPPRTGYGPHFAAAGLGAVSWRSSTRCSTRRSRIQPPPPELDTVEAATLYQTLYWIARTAAVPTPDTDLLHVTAAGWAAIPAIVHKALHGTPMLLTEHGVYVREAYLAAARSRSSPGRRFIATRLARGLTLAAYEGADVIAPVSDANARWETRSASTRADPRDLTTASTPAGDPTPPPGRGASRRGRAHRPAEGRPHDAAGRRRGLRSGSRTPASCTTGRSPPGRRPTDEPAPSFTSSSASAIASASWAARATCPTASCASADVLLMTSISEGMPMGILEAMSHARPVVATSVGGVPEVLRGCGIVAPSGDVNGLAVASRPCLPTRRWRALSAGEDTRRWDRSSRGPAASTGIAA